jgi:DNA-binding protein HU-beta
VSIRKRAGRRMTQAEIVNHIVNATSLNRQQVTGLFAEIVSLARRELKAHKEFVLPGIGELILVRQKPRQGRNPFTGKPIKIPAKGTIKIQINDKLSTSLAGDPTTPSDY